MSATNPCKPNKYCEMRLLSEPSIGYTLTHRFLNIWLRLGMKRCHIASEAEDLALLERLCAAMYREAVYLARRGFFARDMFLEHVTLCGLMGYEEFHRRHWFYKVASWTNDAGCVKEFPNFELNRTRLMLQKVTSVERKRDILTWRCDWKYSPCDDHPTGLQMVVMSHGVRHAAHYISDNDI